MDGQRKDARRSLDATEIRWGRLASLREQARRGREPRQLGLGELSLGRERDADDSAHGVGGVEDGKGDGGLCGDGPCAWPDGGGRVGFQVAGLERALRLGGLSRHPATDRHAAHGLDDGRRKMLRGGEPQFARDESMNASGDASVGAQKVGEEGVVGEGGVGPALILPSRLGTRGCTGATRILRLCDHGASNVPCTALLGFQHGRTRMNAIATARFTLVPQVASHAEEMFVVLSDPAIYEHENKPPPSLEWLRARYIKLESRLSPEGDEQWLNWVIRLPTSELIGYVQATVRPNGRAEIAYELSSTYWGRGLAHQSVQAMIAELVEHYQVRSVSAVLKRGNLRSLRLLERLGFALASPEVSAGCHVELGEYLMQREIQGE